MTRRCPRLATRRCASFAALVVLVALAACGPASPPPVDLGPDAAPPCAPGFVAEADGCRDVDECLVGADDCAPEAVCENRPGSFTCRCPDGYTGDGHTCTDVDECAPGGAATCPAGLTCTNLPGSYACTCPPGDERRGDACEPLGQLVVDADRVCAFHDGTLRCHGDAELLLGVSEAQGGWRGGGRKSDVSCAVDAGGQAYCAGNSVMGRIGDGSEGDGTSSGFVPPRRVSGGHHFVSIDVGDFYTCAIDDGARLWCWGHLYDYMPNQPEPVLLPGDGWTQVSSGGRMGCALRIDGSMWCWGGGVYGTPSTGTLPQTLVPERMGIGRWRSVRVSYFGACAIAEPDASLWCWGDVFGDARFEPQPVPIDAGAWRSIDVSTSHACGVRSDGTLWCWGDNGAGELGTLDAAYANQPVRVDERHDYREVAVTSAATCATRVDGSTWCLGALDGGMITSAAADSLVPLQVGTSHAFTAVAPTSGTTCAIDAGVLECWGLIGLGPTAHRASLPEPVPGQPGGTAWQAITTDGDSVCAASTAGDVWCSGPSAGFAPSIRGFLDEPGGFGHGLCALDLGNQLVCPFPTTDLDLVPGDWRVLSASDGGSSCGIDANQHLFCWGANAHGELGDGTTDPHADPVRTGGDTPWLTVRTFYGGACALRADRTLWCWGLPPGLSGPEVAVPSALRAQDRFTALTGSDVSACAIRDDGTLWCWGTNIRGDQIPLPEQLGSDTWSAITSSDGASTCGIHADGTLWCWGFNTFGQLGQGSFESSVPVLAVP